MTKLQSDLEIGPPIGSGYFGEVYKGMDPVHGEVAVKIMRPKPDEDATAWQARKASLLAEGQKLKQATHPNVVQVYHLVKSPTDDAIHLVMELCGGGSLQSAFEKGPMCLTDVRRITTEIALGLHALHSRGMLHRDIKPSNILIDSRGVAKLGDFGLVTDKLVLGYGARAGYKDHLAPEVYSDHVTSVKTDVWALGMTIYRLLHGQNWYQRSPAPRYSVPDGGFSNQLRWLPHIPKPWRRVIRTALNDNSHLRFKTASDMMNALAKLPTDPDWLCSVAESQITWARQSMSRQINVTLSGDAATRFEWRAWSEPLGEGKRRSLGGSEQKMTQKICEQELSKFFAR
jgi:serine/threonine-protein kinase